MWHHRRSTVIILQHIAIIATFVMAVRSLIFPYETINWSRHPPYHRLRTPSKGFFLTYPKYFGRINCGVFGIFWQHIAIDFALTRHFFFKKLSFSAISKQHLFGVWLRFWPKRIWNPDFMRPQSVLITTTKSVWVKATITPMLYLTPIQLKDLQRTYSPLM